MSNHVHVIREPSAGLKGCLPFHVVCPVIAKFTVVEVLHVFNFPATGAVFITVKDTENVNYNFKGQPEPIISTVRIY